jgi:hypothetical protein
MNDSLTGFPSLPDVAGPLWGIDASSKRIALAMLVPGPRLRWATLSLPQPRSQLLRFGGAYEEQLAFFAMHRDMHGASVVYIEEPFMPRDRREVPTHLLAYGVTLAALGQVLGNRPLVEVGPSRWKAKAMGAGHGHAEKPDILRWAQSVGYTGQLEDEADAIGVCVAGAVLEGLAAAA